MNIPAKPKRKGRVLRLSLRALLIVIGLELALILCVYITSQHMDNPKRSDALVVLGTVIDKYGMPESTLELRLKRTIELYNQGYAPYIIACGGQVGEEPIPESDAMCDYLLAHGIPETAILAERDSLTTIENLRFARRIMAQHDLYTAVIVTSDYHMWRALHIAQDEGLFATGATSPNNISFVHCLWNLARESVTWVLYEIGELS